MTIKDMIEKRAKVWETAKNFVDTHENENGILSAEKKGGNCLWFCKRRKWNGEYIRLYPCQQH